MVKSDAKSSVIFHINGEKHAVDTGSNLPATTALVDYIRDVANLKGTKVMCREGGCGACTVTAKVIDPATGSEVIKSVNSCLTPVLSCDGWDISTVESLGNKHEGYHVIQNRLVNFYGTQCGFCTPGMVMNMHGLLESKKTVGVEDVEKNLDGNICRCTGYRPTLEAFKSLANDAPPELRQKCSDIEDCATCPMKKAGGQGSCSQAKAQPSSTTELKLASGEEWITAKTLEGALTEAARGTVRFVAGNTSTGIFKNEGPYNKFIDINGIPELKQKIADNTGIHIGGLTTLTELINLLQDSAKLPGLEYGARVVTHLERVANFSVRNNGTVAGNLMIKHKHNHFPSDIFTLLEALDARMTLVSAKSKKSLTGCEKVTVEELKPISLPEFLVTDMSMKLIKSIYLPKHEGCHFRSFKVTRRYQNAHAYVNAALLLKVDKNNRFTVEGNPRIVYGGVSGSFIHASGAEASLKGQSLLEEATINAALEALEKEVEPEGGRLESSPEYRLQLVKTLLYKTILEIVGSHASEKLKSGAGDIIRNVSSSKQLIDAEPTDSSLYKSVPKYEAGIQASGEAEYTGDIPYRPDELFAAYVTSTVGCAELKDIDASEALKIPGVARLVTGKDIPGENDMMKFGAMGHPRPEPVFTTDKVEFYGQPLGLILATSQVLARKAAKLVKVTYTNVQKPIVTIPEAIEKAKELGTWPKQTSGIYKTKPSDSIKVEHTFKGELAFGSQYHFYMETQSVICYPREDGIDVHLSTQGMDHVQNAIATVLAIPTNSINLQVRRVGGGFGGKASSSTLIACACAVATWVSNRPVRLILDLESNMSILGKRHPTRIPYEVGFDKDGRIGSLKVDIIGDAGYATNEANSFLGMMHMQNTYEAVGWEVNTPYVVTNTPSNTFCRAPGSIKSVAAIEWIMDRIADQLNMDPISVRLANMLKTGDELLFKMFSGPIYQRENLIPEMLEKMKSTAEYEGRKASVERFNQENRWKKRGIAVCSVRYNIDYWGINIPTSVAIYHMDGHVAVTHGGIEMGQGLNTKVIQTVAHALGIPMDRIKVKATNNFVGANAMMSAGSLTSELACYSVMRACEEIRENLRPILEKLENPSWEQLIKEANTAKVKLTASYTPTGKDDIKGYDVWVVGLTEVEIDVLTGEYKIVRTDLYEDTGKSLSPGVDLGQIEGAYIHGQGYWTTEKIVHDENTGKLLTNGTWDYKVPEAKDIPEDFRITLLTNRPNQTGILRSKATGEPSADAAFSVVQAMRNAIASARKDAGNNEWFEMPLPATPADIASLCLTKDEHLTLAENQSTHL